MSELLEPILGKRVRLTQFTESDITDEYIGWLNDPRVVRYSDQRFRQHNRTTCLQYLTSFCESESLFFNVQRQGDGKAVGTMTAYVAAPHATADMAILIGDRASWGQGFGLDAWGTLMTYLLEKRGLRKVTGGTLRCNVGMVKVMERSGMHLEAIKSRQQIVEGEEQDILCYAKFRDD